MKNSRHLPSLLQASVCLAVLLSALAASNWIRLFHEICRFYVNVPMWDAWDKFSWLDRYPKFDLSVLWIQHNEHRLITTDILFAIDTFFFHGRQILPTVVNIAAYMGVVLLFGYFALRETGERSVMVCAVALASALAGHKIAAVALAIPFLVCNTLYVFFAALSLAFLVSFSKRHNSALLLTLTCVCGVLSTYSSAQGLLLWPLLVLTAMVLRMRPRHIAIIGLVGVMTCGLYFVAYHRVPAPITGSVLLHPFYLVEFVGAFLGMPFSAKGNPSAFITNCYGILAIFLLIIATIFAVRKRLVRTPAFALLASFSIFAILCAALTAKGRADITDPAFTAARAGRYVALPLLFWSAIILLTAWLLLRWLGPRPVLAILVLTAIFGRHLVSVGTYYGQWEQYFRLEQWAAIGVANGVIDSEISAVLFPVPGFIARFEPILKAMRLGAFADPPPYWIGQNVSALFSRISGTSSRGSVTCILPRNTATGRAWEIQGWADASTVLFVDDSEHILGFGLTPRAGPAKLCSGSPSPRLVFTGFIPQSPRNGRFALYALDQGTAKIRQIGAVSYALPD